MILSYLGWTLQTMQPVVMIYWIISTKYLKIIESIDNAYLLNEGDVLVTEDMVGHRLGEFSPTRVFRGHGSGHAKELQENTKR